MPGIGLSKLGYAALGHTVAALDCRGQGGSSEDTGGVTGWTLRGHIIRGIEDAPEKLLYRQIFLDTAQLAKDRDGDAGCGRKSGRRDRAEVRAAGLTLACASLEPAHQTRSPCVPVPLRLPAGVGVGSGERCLRRIG